MKILAVGDLHGSDHWKTIDPKKHDKIIFMGDYIDSFVFTDTEIVHNLKEVIQEMLDYPIPLRCRALYEIEKFCQALIKNILLSRSCPNPTL